MQNNPRPLRQHQFTTYYLFALIKKFSRVKVGTNSHRQPKSLTDESLHQRPSMAVNQTLPQLINLSVVTEVTGHHLFQ